MERLKIQIENNYKPLLNKGEPSDPAADAVEVPEELEEEKDLEQDECDFIFDIEWLFEHFEQYTLVLLYLVVCKYAEF